MTVDRHRLRAIHRRLSARFGPLEPPRSTDPLEELVLRVLSQHTSDANAERAFGSLRAVFPSWYDVVRVRPDVLADVIRSGGLASTKAPRIQAILREVRAREGRFDLAVAGLGGVDLVIHSAGIWPPEEVPVHEMEDARWRRTMRENVDAMFFVSETPESPKHVGALQIFELPPKAPRDYLKKLVARLRAARPEPPFSYRPHFPRAGMPQWEPDEQPDMDYHVRSSVLPAPGAMARLLAFIEGLHSGVLDRTRPCWFCQIVGGLEGRRFAMYTKIHHAYIDGMSGVRRMYGALSESPDASEFQAAWAYREKKRARRAPPGAAKRITQIARAAFTQARALGELYETFARLGLQWTHVHNSYHQVPFDAPRTLINRPLLRAARAFAVCSLPLDRIKAVATAAGAKVNDVVLAVVDAALHDYLGKRGEGGSERLVALCPMSLREDGDDSATTQVAALHVRLGEPGAAISRRRSRTDRRSRRCSSASVSIAGSTRRSSAGS